MPVGTLNVQGLNWCKIGHRNKLQTVITTARKQGLDALCLTELHFTALQVQTVYIEEFVLVCRGTVALLMRMSFAMLWEAGGRQVFFEEDDGRLLALGLCYNGMHLILGSSYAPASPVIGPRREHMAAFFRFSTNCSHMDGNSFGVVIGTLIFRRERPCQTTLAKGDSPLQQQWVAVSSRLENHCEIVTHQWDKLGAQLGFTFETFSIPQAAIEDLAEEGVAITFWKAPGT